MQRSAASGDCEPFMVFAREWKEKTFSLEPIPSLRDCYADAIPDMAGEPFVVLFRQSRATIHAGRNFPASGTTDNALITAGRKNPNIDSPQPATATDMNGMMNVRLLFEPGAVDIPGNQINTSIQPIFLSENNLNVNKVRSRGLSNKVFTHFSYTWPKGNDGWIPYLGIGGEVEFGQQKKRSNRGCDICPTCSLSQWGVWLKGGFSFE